MNSTKKQGGQHHLREGTNWCIKILQEGRNGEEAALERKNDSSCEKRRQEDGSFPSAGVQDCERCDA